MFGYGHDHLAFLIEGEVLSGPESSPYREHVYICLKIENTLYKYEVEKLFQDEVKKNFTRSDIIGIHVKFESRTNSTFGDNLSILFNE